MKTEKEQKNRLLNGVKNLIMGPDLPQELRWGCSSVIFYQPQRPKMEEDKENCDDMR